MDDELAVLSAIYSAPGELHIRPDGLGGKHVTLKIRSMAEPSQPEVLLVFVLASTYPFSLPEVSLYCSSLSHTTIKNLKDQLKAKVDTHQGSHMLMELIASTQQMLANLPVQETTVATSMPPPAPSPGLDPACVGLAHSGHAVNSVPASAPMAATAGAITCLPSHMTCTSQSNSSLHLNHSPGVVSHVSSNNSVPTSNPSSNHHPPAPNPLSVPKHNHALNSIQDLTQSHGADPNAALHNNYAVNNGKRTKVERGAGSHSHSHGMEFEASHPQPQGLQAASAPYPNPGAPVEATGVLETVVFRHCEQEETTTLLLYLDHMRSRTSYVKLISRWVQELWLTGRLLFCDKLILILLQGSEACIKTYLRKHRTENVDVDSRGRPCKEKMMTVLRETNEIENRFLDFQVLEFASRKELEKLFDVNGMGDLYQQCVCIPSKSKSK